MTTKIFMVAALVLSATIASAQTAGDVLDAEGLAGFTPLEEQIGVALLRAGYTEECLELVPMGTVRQIVALVATEGDTPENRDAINLMLERVCE